MRGYNATGLPDGPDRLPLLMATILKKRIRMQGFIISPGLRASDRRIQQQQMGRWVQEEEIKYREQLIDGLDQAPRADRSVKGENFGKGSDPRRGGRLARRASTEQAPFSRQGKGAWHKKGQA